MVASRTLVLLAGQLVQVCVPSPITRVQTEYTIYYPESNRYDPANAKHKFLRQTWNGAIVPLGTIRDGPCASRTDGLCELDALVEYQKQNSRPSGPTTNLPALAITRMWMGTGTVRYLPEPRVYTVEDGGERAGDTTE